MGIIESRYVGHGIAVAIGIHLWDNVPIVLVNKTGYFCISAITVQQLQEHTEHINKSPVFPDLCGGDFA